MVTVQKGNICRLVTASRAQEMVREGYRVVSPPAAPPDRSEKPAAFAPPEPLLLSDAEEKEKLTDETGRYLCQLGYQELKKELARRGVPIARTDRAADLKRKLDDYVEEIKANRKAR